MPSGQFLLLIMISLMVFNLIQNQRQRFRLFGYVIPYLIKTLSAKT